MLYVCIQKKKKKIEGIIDYINKATLMVT